MFKGSIVALVTPFKKGAVDERTFQSLVEWHVREGTHGLVPCGTTGETPVLSEAEHHRLIDLCVEAAHGQVPVIAGTGSNSTEKAVSLARYARKAGADAILVVSPYYNKPTQEGLYQHFKAIHDGARIPMIVYNVPSRTGVEISVETTLRLSGLPGIVGIKDASPDLARPLQMHTAIDRKDFALLSGEDATVAAYLAQGGHGCISVTANVAPKACAQLHEAWQARDFPRFEKLRDRLLPLHKALFSETSPSPVKYAMAQLGFGGDEVRLPLVAASKECRRIVDAAMKASGVSLRAVQGAGHGGKKQKHA